MAKIIIIDDEPAMVEVIVTLCREKGHQVFPFNAPSKALEQMDAIQPQVVITDIKMETMTGFDVLRHVRENHRQTSVILITAFGTTETAVEAMKMGATDYVLKPFKIDELQTRIQKALDYQAAVRENTYLRKELKNRYRFEHIIGTSGKMQHDYNLINKVADTDGGPGNVRVVGPTNEPLQAKLKDGRFREDLYYRLAVIPIEIPALRERLEDVPLLVNHFLQKQASATGGEPKKIEPDAVDILCHYNYPGNVRELENAIERACALCDNDLILPTDLPPHIVSHAKGDKTDQMLASMPVGQTLDDFVQQQERNYIDATLQHCDDSREKAASMLGISMATRYRKIEPKKKEATRA